MRIPANFERGSSGSKDHLVFRDGSVTHDLKWHAVLFEMQMNM